MKGIDEKLVRRVADRAEEAWKAGELFHFWGFAWYASNPVDNWHNLHAFDGEDYKTVAVYQRDAEGEILNLEVLA